MFRHHPDGYLYLGDEEMPLFLFLLDEPGYALPAGMIGREYVPGVRHVLYDGISQHAGPLPWPEGDAYLARLDVYRARVGSLLTLEQVRDKKLKELNAACDGALRALRAQYPDTEVLSWERQEREARAYLTAIAAAIAEAAAQTPPVEPAAVHVPPFIGAMATGRGIAPEVLAQKIVAKADAFSALAAPLFGRRQAQEDQVWAIYDSADPAYTVDMKKADIETISL